MNSLKKSISILLSAALLSINVINPAYAGEDISLNSESENNTTYYINTSSGDGGKITSSFTVKSGQSAVIKIEAAEGYEIAEFTVNGAAAEFRGTEYRIDRVNENYNISVEFKKKTFNIDLIPGEGGTITGNKTVTYGMDAAYTFEPDSGYEIGKVYLDDAEVELNGGTYLLQNIKGHHSLQAEFKKVDCVINFQTPENGTFQVFCNNKEVKQGDILDYGSVIEFLNAPDDYYRFVCYMVNGQQYSGSDFRVKGPVNISALFTKKIYNITSRSKGNGAVLTDDKSQVAAGEGVLVTAVPDIGFTIDQMLINGVDVTEKLNENFQYETTDTWSGLDILVTFKKLKYNIKTSCGANGTISPERTVDYGSDVIVSFRADDGYEIDKVYVDGVVANVGGSDYVFENITAEHQIYVEFKDRFCAVDVNIGENGTATESGIVPYNGEYIIEIAPDEGYQIDEILLNGTPVYSKNGIYELKNIIDDCTVDIIFEPNEIGIPVINNIKSNGVHELIIEWSTIDKAEGYEIYRMDEESYEYKLIADVPAAYFGQKYIDTGRVCGLEYYYQIRAYKIRHDEKLYGEISEEESGISKPGKVSDISLEVTGVDSLQVKWKRVPSAGGYEIFISKEKDGGYSKIAEVSGNKTSQMKLAKLKKGTRYYVKIRAFRMFEDEKIYGSYSSVKNASTSHLNEPKGVKSKMKGFEYAGITWKKVSGADGYSIYWCTKKNGKYEKIANVKGANKLEYKDKFYLTGRNYYKVRAYKMVGKKKVYSCLSECGGVNAIIKT